MPALYAAPAMRWLQLTYHKDRWPSAEVHAPRDSNLSLVSGRGEVAYGDAITRGSQRLGIIAVIVSDAVHEWVEISNLRPGVGTKLKLNNSTHS